MNKASLRLSIAVLILAMAIPAASYAASGITSAVQGTATNGSSFVGSLTVTGFNIVNNAIVATGNLVGSVYKGGNLIGTVNQTVQIPVGSLNGTCTVLTLTLGPLDLNLLGLQVHLNQVVLTITANPAEGILGQLLCSLAGGLNLGGTLQQIVGLLNQILAAL
jgi:hypothetical protein